VLLKNKTLESSYHSLVMAHVPHDVSLSLWTTFAASSWRKISSVRS